MSLTKCSEPANVFWQKAKPRGSGCRRQHCLQTHSEVIPLYRIIPCFEISQWHKENIVYLVQFLLWSVFVIPILHWPLGYSGDWRKHIFSSLRSFLPKLQFNGQWRLRLGAFSDSELRDSGNIMRGGAGATGRDRRMFWQFASRAVYWERGDKWRVAQPRSCKDSEVAPNSLAEHSKAEQGLSSCSGQPAGSWPQGGLAASRNPATEMGIRVAAHGAVREKAEIRMTGNKIKTSC